MKRTALLFFLTGMLMLPAAAQEKDSIKVEALLQKASALPGDSSRTMFFARQMLGVPYVAGTLDEGKEENLVVHLDKVDCTTFVETVLALALADKDKERNFGSFKKALQHIRYRGGVLNGYPSRLHYFSEWIKDNERKGIVKERTDEFSTLQQELHLNFMSTHPDSYRQLKDNPSLVAEIVRQEQALNGSVVTYFPKDQLSYPPYKLNIKDGDILAITTNITGLDVVHVGFVCWVGDTLHLLHASSVAKKVFWTLSQCMTIQRIKGLIPGFESYPYCKAGLSVFRLLLFFWGESGNTFH